MDYEYEEEESFHLRMRLKPSDYFRVNGFVTYERDAVGTRLLDLLGEDNVMWGSDYPHPDGTWPDSMRFLEQELRGCSRTGQTQGDPRQRRQAVRIEIVSSELGEFHAEARRALRNSRALRLL